MRKPADPIIFLVLMFLGGWGCSHDHEQLQRGLDEIKSELAQVKTVQANQSIQQEDVQNRLLLLADEVDSNRLALQRLENDAGAGRDYRPTYSNEPAGAGAEAPGLPVVRISPVESPQEDYAQDSGGEYALKTLDEWGNVVGLEAQAPTAPGETAAPQAKPGSGAGRTFDSRPIMLYQQAMELLKQKDYEKALMTFENFVHQYPNHEYADNCLYWIGETYYDQKLLDKALASFEDVVIRYPSGNKVPDSMLKAAFCYKGLGMTDKALQLLDKLIRSYPGTEAARLAQKSRTELF